MPTYKKRILEWLEAISLEGVWFISLCATSCWVAALGWMEILLGQHIHAFVTVDAMQIWVASAWLGHLPAIVLRIPAQPKAFRRLMMSLLCFHWIAWSIVITFTHYYDDFIKTAVVLFAGIASVAFIKSEAWDA